MLTLITTLFFTTPLIAQNADVPSAMPIVAENDENIINILLIGATTNTSSANVGLTDSLMVISINQDRNTIAVVSIPRDLHVYVPALNEMTKINQVYFLGWRNEEIDEMQALKDTIEYNLGLQIDFHALVNFDTFAELINAFDGIDISVDCAIQDWRLKGPGLDRQDEDSWEMFTLPVGVHHLSGNMALWYARSRLRSANGDIDRGRRQQDIARALWRKIRSEGLLQNFPLLWEELNRIVETDINLSDALALMPLALETGTSDVQYYTMSLQKEVNNSDADGRFVLAPERDAIAELMELVVQPPSTSRLGAEAPTVAIVNASEFGSIAQVAADRLELEGFRPVIIQEDTYKRAASEIIDYTGLSKGNPADIIVGLMRIGDENITVEPDPERDYDYKVYVGRDYPIYSCTRPIEPPREVPVEPDPPPTEPTPVPGA